MKRKILLTVAVIAATALILTGCFRNSLIIDEPYSENTSKEASSVLNPQWSSPDEILGNSEEDSEEPEEPAEPGPMNALTGEDLDGNSYTLGELFAQNDLTMINVWGTFCGPCIREMPDLEELYEDYRDEGFGIVGLTSDLYDFDGNILPGALADAKDIVKENGITYPILGETSEMENYLYSQYVPVTFFVDRNGNFIGESFVGSRDYDEWESIVVEYLEKVK